MASKSMITRRILAAGLACWFTVMTVFIHGIHRHSTGGAGSEAGHSCSPNSDHLISTHGGTAATPLAFIYESNGTANDDFDYCPACLILKSCKSRAVVWKSPFFRSIPDNNSQFQAPLEYASFVVTNSSPRAPPIIIS